jgi:hypothetical protein
MRACGYGVNRGGKGLFPTQSHDRDRHGIVTFAARRGADVAHHGITHV